MSEPLRSVACVLLALGIASIGSTDAVDSSSASSQALDAQDAPDYRGRILGQSGGTVNVWTERRPSGRTEVDIEFVGLEQVCESGPRLGDFLLGTDDVTAERRFEALFAAGTELSLNDIDLNLAEGQLLPKGRARGYVFTYHDPFDPPGGEFNQDECATDGKVRWQARKVDHREQGGTLTGTSARRSGRAPGRAEVASASKERYEGYVGSRDDGSDFVSLDVERESGGRKVSFQTEFNLSCDSADRRLTIGPIRARLDRNGHFRQALYAETRSPRHRYFTRVRGDLLPGGKAKGVITTRPKSGYASLDRYITEIGFPSGGTPGSDLAYANEASQSQRLRSAYRRFASEPKVKSFIIHRVRDRIPGLGSENGRYGVVHHESERAGDEKMIYCLLAARAAGLSPSCESAHG